MVVDSSCISVSTSSILLTQTLYIELIGINDQVRLNPLNAFASYIDGFMHCCQEKTDLQNAYHTFLKETVERLRDEKPALTAAERLKLARAECLT